jgi:hypothetical protein
MNKQELISAIASAANLSTVEAACALDATTDAITHALAQGSDVRLIGFGFGVIGCICFCISTTTCKFSAFFKVNYAYIFGAACPAKDKALGLVLPLANTDGMIEHLLLKVMITLYHFQK